MPVVPNFDPVNVPNPAALPEANPAAFSGLGQALAQGGAQVSDALHQWDAQYSEAARQSDAATRLADGTQKLGETQTKWSKLPDHVAAVTGFNADVAGIRANLLKDVSDPLVASLVSRQFDQEAAFRAIDVGHEAFQWEASDQNAKGDARLNQYALDAANATNPLMRAHIVDQATADLNGRVAAGWLKPEEGEQRALGFKSQVAEVNVRQDINRDPELAMRRLADPNAYPGLLPERREVQLYRAENRYQITVSRQLAAQAHADVMAQKNLEHDQASNFTRLMADVDGGQELDTGRLADLVQQRAISESGAMALRAAQRERPDDLGTTLALHERLNAGTLTYDDINNATANGRLRAQTAVELTQAVGARATETNTANIQANFDVLRTALMGHQLEKSLIEIGDPTARAAAQLWSQAQSEYQRRARVNHEDPATVVADMLSRYRMPIPDARAYPLPRFASQVAPGKAPDQLSLDDLTQIATLTAGAARKRQMDQATFNDEVTTINGLIAIAQQKAKQPPTDPRKIRPGTTVSPAPGSE